MEKKNYKLLAACDGSDLALDAVRYIGATFPPDRTEVVLFYVDTKIPRSFWNMERQMDFKFQPCNIRASMANQLNAINDFMDKARQILFKAGFSENSVTKKIHAKRQGIVRDIIDESLQGYDALILGRKGRSRVKDILFGSVPERLLGKIRNIPLIIVGGVPVHKNILIAFDGSRIIRRAVKCIGSMIEDYDSRFLLCHALKSPGLFNKETEDPGTENSSVTEYNLFEDSKTFLRNAGFPVSQVSCEIINAPKNFSENIIEKAKQGNYGTIVIGRRDLSRIKQFFTGRVGDKIFQLADNLIIWIIQ
ncbi:MAG: universal stress protein [Desulfobacteraceae bacterium]